MVTFNIKKFSFFIFKEKKYARKFRVERTFSEKVVQQAFRQFFYIFSDFLIQNCGQDGNFFNCVQAHRYRQEIYGSNAEKKRCTHAESTRLDRVATSFLPFVFFIYIYSVKIIQKHSRRMRRNDIYTLYIGNNITKFGHLSLNMVYVKIIVIIFSRPQCLRRFGIKFLEKYCEAFLCFYSF